MEGVSARSGTWAFFRRQSIFSQPRHKVGAGDGEVLDLCRDVSYYHPRVVEAIQHSDRAF
jgi:hypothetical protein